ncbi:hypothetical protein AB0C34_09375 [Nocardia sp. NPDC049220]|uniref:hypothetical protein n=1 Tax=Nocardia sp. NPDC049220 TaxID=3155273 RepID=UPI0033D7EA8D
MNEIGFSRPAPWPYHLMPQPGRAPRVRAWDLALAVVLYCAAAVLGMAAAYFTLFFAFAADSCTPDNCRSEYLTWGFAVSWGGTAFALLGSLALIIVAVVKRWYLWMWPVLAMVLIVGSFFGGAALATRVYTQF